MNHIVRGVTETRKLRYKQIFFDMVLVRILFLCIDQDGIPSFNINPVVLSRIQQRPIRRRPPLTHDQDPWPCKLRSQQVEDRSTPSLARICHGDLFKTSRVESRDSPVTVSILCCSILGANSLLGDLFICL